MPFKGEKEKKRKGEKMANATNVFGFASFIPYSFSLFHLFTVDKFVAKHLFTLSLFHLFIFSKLTSLWRSIFSPFHPFTFSPFHLFTFSPFP